MDGKDADVTGVDESGTEEGGAEERTGVEDGAGVDDEGRHLQLDGEWCQKLQDFYFFYFTQICFFPKLPKRIKIRK